VTLDRYYRHASWLNELLLEPDQNAFEFILVARAILSGVDLHTALDAISPSFSILMETEKNIPTSWSVLDRNSLTSLNCPYPKLKPNK
jgi:hypothetical protein